MRTTVCWDRPSVAVGEDPLLLCGLRLALEKAAGGAALREAREMASAGWSASAVLECLPVTRLSVWPAVREGWRYRPGPRAVEGSWAALRKLAEPGGVPIWLRSARRLVVRTSLGENPLSQMERQRLWELYGLPAFELLSGLNGELLAAECDAHSGLHLRGSAVFELIEGELVATSLGKTPQPMLRLATGWRGSLDRRRCDCGGDGPRFVAR